MKIKVEKLLNEVLPKKAWQNVSQEKAFYGGDYLRIEFAACNYAIHDVRGQFPQRVSLMLDLETFVLKTQVYGGNGGNSIYRQINPENPYEKYLAIKSIKIPFRMPKKEEKFILNAIKKFAQNWVNAIRENKDKLCYREHCNYDELLAS